MWQYLVSHSTLWSCIGGKVNRSFRDCTEIAAVVLKESYQMIRWYRKPALFSAYIWLYEVYLDSKVFASHTSQPTA
jgi:hypothetical protein